MADASESQPKRALPEPLLRRSAWWSAWLYCKALGHAWWVIAAGLGLVVMDLPDLWKAATEHQWSVGLLIAIVALIAAPVRAFHRQRLAYVDALEARDHGNKVLAEQLERVSVATERLQLFRKGCEELVERGDKGKHLNDADVYTDWMMEIDAHFQKYLTLERWKHFMWKEARAASALPPEPKEHNWSAKTDQVMKWLDRVSRDKITAEDMRVGALKPYDLIACFEYGVEGASPAAPQPDATGRPGSLRLERSTFAVPVHVVATDISSNGRVGFSMRVCNGCPLPIRLAIRDRELLYGDRLVHHVEIDGASEPIPPGSWSMLSVFASLVGDAGAEIEADMRAGKSKQFDLCRLRIDVVAGDAVGRLKLPDGLTCSRRDGEWVLGEIVQMTGQA